MIEYTKRVAMMGTELKKDLNSDERNLLSVAYKNSVGARRSAWRAVAQLEQREFARESPEVAKIVMDYRLNLENELNEKCKEILDLINTTILPVCKQFGESPESE